MIDDAELVRCSYFVTKKKRFCKLTTLNGKSRCAQHVESNETDGTAEARIQCPLDPKHTCLASAVDKHILKCNSRVKEYPKYYSRNCNVNDSGFIEEIGQVCLSSVPSSDLLDFIHRVETATEDIIRPSSPVSGLSHPVVNVELEKCVDGGSSSKHLKQNSALLALMQQIGVLNDGHCFVEFGAGRGQTSFWISKSIQSSVNSEFILVEHSSLRHKFDNRLKTTDGPNVKRLKLGIEHLNLADAVNVHNTVGHGKHLCGAATDFALQCLKNYQSSSETELRQVCSVVFALCCHHRCSWSSYTGKDFLLRKGFTAKDFSILCRMSSWATCGSRLSLDKECNDEGISSNPEVQPKYTKLDLSIEDRESIGSKCKLLIDTGRIHFLSTLGLNASLVKYVTKDISLENMAIVCAKQSMYHGH